MSFADTFEDICGQVVILNILESAFNYLTNVERLSASGLRSQRRKPTLGFGREPDRSNQYAQERSICIRCMTTSGKPDSERSHR